MSQPFDFERLVELCRHTHEETRRSAARAVDRSLVVRNWLFGWYIVEYEQRGADRAEYGAQALRKLSAALQERIGRGFSVRYLRQFRRFYVEFKEVVPEFEKRRTAFSVSVTEKIRQTLFSELPVSHGEESGASVPVLLLQRFPLGWSHYVTLLSVTDPEARRFYEIEAGLPEPEFEIGAGFLIRIWPTGDRVTTGSDGEPPEKPPENRQETARSEGRRNPGPFLTASWLSFVRIRPRADAKSPRRSAPRDPSSGIGWTSCARPGRSSE